MPKFLRHPVAIATLLATCLVPSPAGDSSPPKNLFADLNPPAVPGVAVRNVTPTSAELEWPASLSPTSRFRVEMRHFALGDDGELKMDWAEIPGVSIRRHDEVHRARLSGLLPRQPWWIRVRPAEPAGAEPLFTVRFDTPARAPLFTTRRVTLGLLLLVLAAVVGLQWWQRRR